MTEEEFLAATGSKWFCGRLSLSGGQRGTISKDDGATDLCQDGEPVRQSSRSARWDDKDGPSSC